MSCSTPPPSLLSRIRQAWFAPHSPVLLPVPGSSPASAAIAKPAMRSSRGLPTSLAGVSRFSQTSRPTSSRSCCSPPQCWTSPPRHGARAPRSISCCSARTPTAGVYGTPPRQTRPSEGEGRRERCQADYLDVARDLAAIVERRYADSAGGYFDVADAAPADRTKHVLDDVLPGANAG